MKVFAKSIAARSALCSLLLFVVTVGTTRADNTPEYTMKCGGLERTYRLHIPDNLPENAPLVIVLHGYGTGPEFLTRRQTVTSLPSVILREKDGRGKMC